MKVRTIWIICGMGVILTLVGYATLAANLAFESMRTLNCHSTAGGAATNCKPVRVTQMYGGAIALVAGTAISVGTGGWLLVGWVRKRRPERRVKENA